MKALDMSMAASVINSGSPPWALRSATKPLDRFIFLTLSTDQQFAPVKIEEKGDILMAAFGGGFVHADATHLRVVLATAGQLCVGVEDAPQAFVGDRKQRGNHIDRHVPSHGHHQRLEQKGEARSGPCPRDLNQLCSTAAIGALNPWNTGVEVCLVLEKIQVPPLLLHGVMCWRQSAAHRTRKACTPLKVDGDVKTAGLFAEGNRSYLPRGNDSKGKAKKSFRLHGE